MTKPRGNLGLRHFWGPLIPYPLGARRCPEMPLAARGLSNHRATKTYLATRFIRRKPLCSGPPEQFGLAVSRQKVRQLLDGPGEVVKPAVGVARREGRRRMPGQLLQSAQVDAGPPP